MDILGADAPGIYEAVKPSCQHLVVCGSLWMFGEPRVVPTPEETQNPCGFEGYARRYEEMLATRERAQADGIAFSAVMPPTSAVRQDPRRARRAQHRGSPLAPARRAGDPTRARPDAHRSVRRLGRGSGFFLSIQNREAAAGEIFNVGSAYALTARQFIEVYAGIYGVEIPIEWVSWEEYATRVSPNPGANYHLRGHMCPDLTKIRTKLGYVPRYTPEERWNAPSPGCARKECSKKLLPGSAPGGAAR